MDIMDVFNKISRGLATLDDQDEALKKPYTAYYFAKHIEGADIEKCQKAACKDLYWTYSFACDIGGTDIEKCQEILCKHPKFAYFFAKDVPGADIKKCLEACKGTEYENALNNHIIIKALT